MHRFDVACVGISCADVLAKPVGELPEKGKLDLVDELHMRIGGCAANAAIDLARLGMRTVFCGKTGDDGFGSFLADTMRNEGVDISGLKADPAAMTSASVVMIDSDGERSIIHSIGANARFTFEDINLDLVLDSKILLVAGTFLMPAFDGAGTAKLLKAAGEAGVIRCLDTAWDSTGRWLETIRQALPLIDWFMPSYEEAREMSGKTNPLQIAEAFTDLGVKNVVVKLGRDGCFVKPADHKGFYSTTYKEVPVADTSGAGDAFCAGFLTGLALDWDLEKCAKFANAVGSHCVMEIGTTAGIRPMAEILEFMEQHK